MRTWDDWSDFEINKAVAESALIDFSINYGEVCVMKFDEHHGDYFPEPINFCENWEDMGQLIVGADISLFMDVSTKPKAWTAVAKGWWNARKGFISSLDGDMSYTHKNPLRAAAIVFLMMNGVKP